MCDVALDSMQEIFDRIETAQIPFWRVVLETDMDERQVTEGESLERMRFTWKGCGSRGKRCWSLWKAMREHVVL